jgi:hypothetical protein
VSDRRIRYSVGILVRMRSRLALIVVCIALCAPSPARAQARLVNGASLQEIANGILSLMGFSLTPDVTTGSLAISSDPSGNPNIDTTALGGGFTVSAELPLYLEGTIGRSFYDPIFLVSQGQEQRSVESKWHNVSVSGGIGWDFPVAQDLKFRPVLNLSYGRVQTDGSVAGFVLEELTGEEIEFLTGGTLNAFGVGGTLMLDYERYRPNGEVDVELRYTYINLNSTSKSSTAVQGSSDAQSASLWMRWRAPTSMSALGKPVRYVLEAARTEFLGDLRGVLGFTALNSLGVGLELDSSAQDIIVTRTRLVVRYQFGGNVDGASIGMALSF